MKVPIAVLCLLEAWEVELRSCATTFFCWLESLVILLFWNVATHRLYLEWLGSHLLIPSVLLPDFNRFEVLVTYIIHVVFFVIIFLFGGHVDFI